jgi:hypothetical protein
MVETTNILLCAKSEEWKEGKGKNIHSKEETKIGLSQKKREKRKVEIGWIWWKEGEK